MPTDCSHITDPLFHTFRNVDAEDGIVRSYAHTWCQAAAIAHVVDALVADPSARFVLAMAQHHSNGDRTAGRREVYREGTQIRSCPVGLEGEDRMLAALDYGIAHATSELAFSLLACKPDGYIIFRQP